jgi:Uma2 family endonuclease
MPKIWRSDYMLADNGIYELLNGIICMSPRPSTFHQRILTRLSIEIGKYLENQRPLETLVQN